MLRITNPHSDGVPGPRGGPPFVERGLLPDPGRETGPGVYMARADSSDRDDPGSVSGPGKDQDMQRLEEKPRDPTQDQREPVGPGSRSIRVMIVDDHDIVREGLHGILGDVNGIEVVAEASNGRDAIHQLDGVEIHVVIMDISMPEMDGLEATRWISRERPDVRVIGLSMHEMNEMAQSMIEAGAYTYLTKGGPSSGLIEAIRQAGAPSDPGS